MRSATTLLAASALALGLLVTPGSAQAAQARLPAAVDLTRSAVPAGDQGSGGSCNGWSIGYALVGWYSRHLGYAGQPFAPMYVYAQIDHGVDNGSSTTDALNLLVAQGIDTWADYTQGPNDYLTQPTAAQRAHAAHWRISGYKRLFDHGPGHGGGSAGVTALKTALAADRPVAVAFTERPGFDQVRGTAVDHDATGANEGEHEVIAMGYDASGLLVQNSFGTAWGVKGFGRIGWNVVEHDFYSAYTIDGFAALAKDKTPPAVSAPTHVAKVGVQAGTTGASPVTVAFTARDASGISATRLQRRTDNGAWTDVRLPSGRATAVTVTLKDGHRYRFRASARDTAGNWSSARAGSAFTVSVRSDTSSAIRYSGGWQRYRRGAAIGQHGHLSRTAGASATLTFTGRSVTWIATEGPDRTRARIYLDGVYRGTVQLHSARTRARIVVARTTAARTGRHTLRVVELTSSGRTTIDVDGFVVTS